MNFSSKSSLIVVLASFLTMTIKAQTYNWELVQTQETNQLVVREITEQGYLVATTPISTFVSKDRGTSWEASPDVPRLREYEALGEDKVLIGTWGITGILDLQTGTFDTITTLGGPDIYSTKDGNITFLMNRDLLTVIDLDGNLISQDTIKTNIFIRDIFIETGFPTYTLALDNLGYFVNDLSDDFEITGDKRYIPDPVNFEYFYSSGILYSGQSYSPDGGVTWIDYNLPATAGPVVSHTVQDDIVYVAADKSLFISTDRGASFVENGHNEEFTGRVQIHVTNGLISISSDSRRDNNFITSIDGGDSWTSGNGVFSGIYTGVAANSQGTALSLNNEDIGYYGNYTGLEALENGSFILSEPNQFCISPNGQSDWQCTDFTFFEFFYGVSIKKDKVYVSSFDHLMVSNDDGATFQLFETDISSSDPTVSFNAFAPLAFFDNNKFIFTNSFGFIGPLRFILYDLATDSGIELSKELNFDTHIDIETSFTGPTVYILEYTDENRTALSLLESNDEGLNFTATTLDIPVVTDAPYELLTDHNGNLIIYSDKQIFINQNQGSEWVDIAPGLDLTDDIITDITVSFDDDAIYVSLREGGIFRLGCMIADPLAEDCISPLVDFDNDGYFTDVDCDDNNAAINPGSPETCNGIDENCDGNIDEGLTTARYYQDNDGDGYGIESVFVDNCQQPSGFAEFFGDCDDTSTDINPDADEIPNNGIDEDCDGLDFISSVHELSDATLNLYPNPAVDVINIEVKGSLDYQATLYNLVGQLVHTAQNTNLIRVDALTTGIYLLEIRDLQRNQTIIERIVVD